MLLLSVGAACTQTSSNKKEVSVSEYTPPASTDFINISEATKIETVLCQNWQHTDDLESLQNANDDDELMLPFRAFHFANDHSFIKNPRNAMEYGNWSYDDDSKMITLSYKSSKETDRYKIRAIAVDELKLTNAGLNTQSVIIFSGDSISYQNQAANPFHIDNNQWRIRPAKAETNAQIRERIKGCMRFYLLFYKDHIARRTKTISFYGFPTCFRWYAGGIYLVKQDELKDNWFACFYNKEQAMKGYKIVDSLLDLKYTWSKDPAKNWVVKNSEVLQQMYDKLK